MWTMVWFSGNFVCPKGKKNNYSKIRLNYNMLKTFENVYGMKRKGNIPVIFID